MLNDMIGRTIGRYQIVEHLGRGGMAEVFKAYQASLDRYVALKLMHSFLAEDSEFYARFEREAKNIAALRHPNIIQIHDFDREGPSSYMVMEFVDGGTLKDRLTTLAAKNEILPLNEAISIIKDVGSALAFAHGAGMIHRDIKPANVLIDRKGRVILTDFGIAKMVSSAKFTASGSLLGTPAYMAPEQGLGQPGDNRADIYSLGVMLYQLTTGVLPFESDTPVAVILKHINEPLPMPRTIKPELPIGLERIIAKAMAKDANQRYQNIEDMLSDLGDLDKAALIPIPEATMVINARNGTTGAIPTVSGGKTPTASPDATMVQSGIGSSVITPIAKPEERRGGLPIVPIVLGLIIIALLALIGTAIALGPQLIAGMQGPTSTPIIITVIPGQTLPPDLSPEVLAAITQQAATGIAQQATIEALQATDTPQPTQDFTATALACPLGVELASQAPADNAAINTGRTTPIVLELLNSGECAWEDGTTFVLEDGDDPRAANAPVVEIPATAPGATVRIEIPFAPATAKTYTTTWQVRLPDGRDVGEPIVLTYRAIPAATARPTTVPVTRPPNVSPTPFTESPLTGVNLTNIRNCDYEGSSYLCQATVVINGGAPTWTVVINGADTNCCQPFEPNTSRTVQIGGSRCEVLTMDIIVVDADQNQASNTVVFNPNASAVFPGGTVCSP